jgi:hypothetical protein
MNKMTVRDEALQCASNADDEQAVSARVLVCARRRFD